MSEEMTPQQRYVKAAHAVQSGVKFDMATDPNQQSQGASTPKHLRVGLNNVMADHGSLAKLLIDKGIITEAEYLDAIADGIEREQARYEQILTSRLGKPVTLA
jgi:hypothetical protein